LSEDQGRRSDDVDPATRLFVNEKVSEAKHALRSDVAALGAKVELFSAQSTKEHAEVASKLDRLAADVAELKPLASKVAALELADARAEVQAQAADQFRAQSRSQFRWLVGLIVAAIPSAAAITAYVSH
jgi:hypothetical protein